jgi:hypothetical protein
MFIYEARLITKVSFQETKQWKVIKDYTNISILPRYTLILVSKKNFTTYVLEEIKFFTEIFTEMP